MNRLSKRDKDKLACCGKCGYAVRGITALNCPECGGDLREVGIKLPGQHTGAGLAGLLLCWTLLVLIVGLVIINVLAASIPHRNNATHQLTLHPQANQYRRLEIKIYSHGWRFGYGMQSSSSGGHSSSNGKYTIQYAQYQPVLNLDRIELKLWPLQAGPPIELTLKKNNGGSYPLGSGATRSHVDWPPTQPQVEYWFKAHNITASADEVQDIAMMLSDIAYGAQVLQLETFSQVNTNSATRSSGQDWVRYLLTFGFFFLWIAGLIYFIRRNRPQAASV